MLVVKFITPVFASIDKPAGDAVYVPPVYALVPFNVGVAEVCPEQNGEPG